MANLIAVNGPFAGRTYDLNAPQVVLGRHPDCSIILDGAGVSRTHAAITQRGTDFVIEDLKSRNRTFVNGVIIEQPSILRDGDLIRICDLEFSFHDRVAPAQLESNAGSRDGSSFGILLIDDGEENPAPFTSKLDLTGSQSGSMFSTSAEARLSALLEISNALGRAISLEEVLPKVLDSLFKIFLQADRGFIVLRGEDGELRPRWSKTRRENQEENIRISRTVLREVMESKQAIISQDATVDDRFSSSESIADFRIRSIIVAPLLNSNDEPIGVLQMDTQEQRNRFEQKDLEILMAVANQAGISIENAQLHEQILESKLVEQDLNHARMVQLAFVPNSPLTLHGYGCFHYYNPMQQVGGDYFDYIQLPDGKIAIVVADVTGHGIAAAMFMAKVSAETRFALGSEDDPARAITLLNRRLARLMVERFVTMIVTILDPLTGKVVTVNAGHMPPILRRAKGEIIEPGKEEAGLALGITDDWQYEAVTFQLEHSDIFALYTDGINECVNEKGDQFGIQKITEIIASKKMSPSVLGNTVMTQVTTHMGKAPPFDDMCLVILGRNDPAAQTI
ncbi:MAG: SpoIIE family protein phosphatase [Planctomycetaceae bacterium]|nr:SpoIIE family protein phosphatase [Planctomycetaceae bacterium]MBN8603740.1 SpoIIE family protein phosphatase [Planctomycetota bacterium]